MKPLRHRPHVYIRKEAISKKQPERATNTGLRRPQARPRGRRSGHLPFSRLLDHLQTLEHSTTPEFAPTFSLIFSVFAPRDLWPLHALPSQSASKLVGSVGRLCPSTRSAARPGHFRDSPSQSVRLRGPHWPRWIRRATKAAVSNGARRLVGRRPDRRRRLAKEGGAAGSDGRHL